MFRTGRFDVARLGFSMSLVFGSLDAIKSLMKHIDRLGLIALQGTLPVNIQGHGIYTVGGYKTEVSFDGFPNFAHIDFWGIYSHGGGSSRQNPATAVESELMVTIDLWSSASGFLCGR